MESAECDDEVDEGDDEPGVQSISYCRSRHPRSYLHWYRATQSSAWCFADDDKHKKLGFKSGLCGGVRPGCKKFKGDKMHYMCKGCAIKNGLCS